MFTFTNVCFRNYFKQNVNYVLYLLTVLEQKTNIKWFRHLKVYILREMIKYKDYGNNEITNIICTRPDKNGNCTKAIEKLKKYKTEIFEISPRGLVYCVINKNKNMLDCLEQMGYPLEMVLYADNYKLLQKHKINI